jgi:23S rRNA (uracil1939-C5)-methyltransferase
MKNIIEIKIDRLAYRGDAIGKLPDGRVVFIPYAIPGELVRVKLVEDKPRYVRAELMEVVEASDERVLPRCQHFGVCGGCHYQHMNYPAQLKAKAGILHEQLERIGNIKEIPSVVVKASPEAWYYRNHIQFHLTDQGKLGFKKAFTNLPFPIGECHLPEAEINQLWPQIEIKSFRGIDRVGLRLGVDQDVMLILEGSGPPTIDLNLDRPTLSVVHVSASGNKTLAGRGYILMEVSGKRFRVSPTSFFQINTGQASAIIKQCINDVHLTQNMTVLDVYSGVGLFSAFIAPMVKRLVGIELSPEACADFSYNLNEFDNVELYEAKANQVLGSIQFTPDLIFMDPPRAGLGMETVHAVLAQGAERLVYISCDPATLGRDGKQLALGGYSLSKIYMFDMFPQTYHIESLSVWEKQ